MSRESYRRTQSGDAPDTDELVAHAGELLVRERELLAHTAAEPEARHAALRPSRIPTARAQRAIELRRFAGPAAFVDRMSPLRLCHLTDMHVGAVTSMKIQMAAIERVNESAPDLVVITGDFVCHSQVYLDDLSDVIGRIQAPVLAVLGNHDHWSGANGVRTALKRARAEVLDNAWTSIELRGQRLQIMGLDDAYTGHANREKALSGLDPRVPTIGLSHIAEEADALWAMGVPFVLSGHTHAGQITLARLHEIAIGRLAGHKYVHGLYGDRALQAHPGAVYVGAGIGSAVIPFRFGERARREVTVFELGTAIGAFDEHHAEQPALPGRKPTEALMQKRRAKVLKKAKKRGEIL